MLNGSTSLEAAHVAGKMGGVNVDGVCSTEWEGNAAVAFTAFSGTEVDSDTLKTVKFAVVKPSGATKTREAVVDAPCELLV